MAAVQVREWRVHPSIETIQNEGPSGKGAVETSGAATAKGWGGRGSKGRVVRVPVRTLRLIGAQSLC
jgi:hypothetical protein